MYSNNRNKPNTNIKEPEYKKITFNKDSNVPKNNGKDVKKPNNKFEDTKNMSRVNNNSKANVNKNNNGKPKPKKVLTLWEKKMLAVLFYINYYSCRKSKQKKT